MLRLRKFSNKFTDEPNDAVSWFALKDLPADPYPFVFVKLQFEAEGDRTFQIVWRAPACVREYFIKLASLCLQLWNNFSAVLTEASPCGEDENHAEGQNLALINPSETFVEGLVAKSFPSHANSICEVLLDLSAKDFSVQRGRLLGAGLNEIIDITVQEKILHLSKRRRKIMKKSNTIPLSLSLGSFELSPTQFFNLKSGTRLELACPPSFDATLSFGNSPIAYIRATIQANQLILEVQETFLKKGSNFSLPSTIPL
jgi:hypothetical protein